MRIYLASPYSHPSERTRIWRFSQACDYAGRLIAAGYICYSPIAHSHPIASHCDLPLGWEFWKQIDCDFLTNWADVMVVLTLPDWLESVGIREETLLAVERGLPVRYWSRNTPVESLNLGDLNVTGTTL